MTSNRLTSGKGQGQPSKPRRPSAQGHFLSSTTGLPVPSSSQAAPPLYRPRIGGGIRVVHPGSAGISQQQQSLYTHSQLSQNNHHHNGHSSHLTSSHSHSRSAAQRGNGDDRNTPSTTTSQLYKRILYPGINDNPPRILHTTGTEQVDTHLYTLLALICRGFITPWYSKISRDRAFLHEIVKVASHVFREFEILLVENGDEKDPSKESDEPESTTTVTIDKIRLIYCTLPRILQRHIEDYKTAKQRCRTAYSAGALISNTNEPELSELERIFHSIQPHAAICSTSFRPPQGPDDESSRRYLERIPSTIDADYLRAAVDALLVRLLPPQDSAAETEKSVLREVIVGIILDGVFRKVTQPWFLFNLIIKLLEGKGNPNPDPDPLSFDNVEKPTAYDKRPLDPVSRLFALVAYLTTLFYQMTALFGYLSWLFTISFASSHYRRYSRRRHPQRNITLPWLKLVFTAVGSGANEKERRYLLSQLDSTLSGLVTVASPLLDRIIVHFMYSRIFTIGFTCKILKIIEDALFPEGFPAPSVPDPTREEQVRIREKALNTIAALLPREATRIAIRNDESEDEDARLVLAAEMLEPFSSAYINSHLNLFILDTLVANICPDLVVNAV